MRNISFALTTEQVRRRKKTVTRRIGWKFLRPGTLLQPVVRSQGLKKGERAQKIGGPIRVIDVRRERLNWILREEPYGSMEVQREGFGGTLTPRMFVEFLCKVHRVDISGSVWMTRIEFDYVDEARA